MRNEAPFLLEWIAHLQGAGVTDFLIYSNDCTDGTDHLLDHLHRAGVLTHVPQTVAADVSPQWQALKAAWKHPLRRACDWALVCDVDEFINIHAGNGTIADLLSGV
ncbi:glycosyltransferase family 2 protein, partial [Roseovarius azorensis]|uniref:glycosyltransferase family 2 protein n=1 Tax=Roseovarius azorensis TaxID=1287727 RepID=UPI001FE3B54B